jgi:hypothetical protein
VDSTKSAVPAEEKTIGHLLVLDTGEGVLLEIKENTRFVPRNLSGKDGKELRRAVVILGS